MNIIIILFWAVLFIGFLALGAMLWGFWGVILAIVLYTLLNNAINDFLPKY